MSVEGSVRERRRAETVAEIKAAALDQLSEVGTALSLRGVARAIGMTVQSLYHYFAGRDALLAALVTDAHGALADAVDAAAAASRGAPPADRLVAACAAFRAWALANRSGFLLLYGTPVPGFDPEASAGPGPAALRLAAPFAEVVFDGWTPAELAALPVPPGGEGIERAADLAEIPLPVGALALFIELRAQLHGLVMLELLGHLHPFNDVAEALFTASSLDAAARIAAAHARVAGD